MPFQATTGHNKHPCQTSHPVAYDKMLPEKFLQAKTNKVFDCKTLLPAPNGRDNKPTRQQTKAIVELYPKSSDLSKKKLSCKKQKNADFFEVTRCVKN